MNKVILTGRLTADPELRQTQSGISSCRFTVAVNRKMPDKNTGERQADFISCQAWRQTADFISNYFSKGSMICIEGTLRTGSYQDKNYPDVTHYTTDLLVENVEFCGSKNNQTAQAIQTTQQTAMKTTQNYASMADYNSSDFEEILSDGDVPF